MVKLIQGVGINDADYRISESKLVGNKRVQIWICPFYQTWVQMIKRCYSQRFHDTHPTYIGCSVADEWKTFSNFKKWMEKQDWQGKELDKDLLIKGNKVYCSETCVFVSKVINVFITDSTSSRGDLPVGVYWHKGRKKYMAYCGNPFTKKQEYLGLFNCSELAHQAWSNRKHDFAKQLALLQKDARVSEALISRYVDYRLIHS